MIQTMNRRRVAFALGASGVVWLAAVIAGQGTAKVPGNIWPPAKKQMAKSIALSPEEEMKTFSMPPGYRVELVASDPMIESPILMDFDADGRLWVLEMLTFLPDTSGRDSREPGDDSRSRLATRQSRHHAIRYPPDSRESRDERSAS